MVEKLHFLSSGSFELMTVEPSPPDPCPLNDICFSQGKTHGAKSSGQFSSASYSKSQQHLTKVIMAFFLKPFLSHLPEHTNSLVFAIFLFLVSFECSWPLNIRRLRTLSLHFSFFLILIFKFFY